MILRPATPDDAQAVVFLEQELFAADAWTVASVLTELTGTNRAAVVATEQQDLLGYAVTMRSGDAVDLHRVGVHPTCQRVGLAGSMLAALSDRARADGADRMLLEVSSNNRAARAFYANEGFEEIDRRPRYYRDGSDALVLRRPLTTGGGKP